MRAQRDVRLGMIALTLLLIGVLGGLVHWLPTAGVSKSGMISEATRSATRQADLQTLFRQAVTALQAKHFAQAERVLHTILTRTPRLPEAHVNMGFAQLGLGRTQVAADFFTSAIELRASLPNAYYGLAVALERGGDLPGALGAMRSYIHLTQANDPYLSKARAALWEWETQLTQVVSEKRPSP